MNMTTMMKHCWLRRATCAILILMATLTNVLAQPREEKFNPEKFRADLRFQHLDAPCVFLKSFVDLAFFVTVKFRFER